ncbi:MAG: hypothetical protein AB8B71_00620 [Paracoccaceae bacterium]
MARQFNSFYRLLGTEPIRGSLGPIALILFEDPVEVDSTLRHHLQLGFQSVIALMPPQFEVSADLSAQIWRSDFDTTQPGALEIAVNTANRALPGRWIYAGYNAEYLFFPFCETRSIGEMLAFHTEERRDAMLCYVVDLYADNLDKHPNAVSLSTAHLDKTGYYALKRTRDGTDEPLERQMDFYGGLRWRLEEHIPENKRKIDRITLFKAKPGLTMQPDYTFNDDEYNTYACPWHNNLTATVCSFRTAKALRTNPGSRHQISRFTWHNSVPFEWQSRQLLDLGLMEPGQWF